MQALIGIVMHQTAPPLPRAAFRPLYAQVKALLVERIAAGGWRPGELLPSEFELASEYQVSQGTIRKALTRLEAERLIVRHQGRGTYVAQHSREETLFHFFRIVDDADRRLTPVSVVLRQRVQPGRPEQTTLLAVAPGSPLHAIVRIRYFAGVAAIFERIFVPVALMPALAVERGRPLEEEMYVIYQASYGISVARASERLTAIAASAEEARHLQIAPGAPLLKIERVARDVSGAPVELRISSCKTSPARYAAEVY